MKYPNDTDFFCPDLLVVPVIWGVLCVPCVCVGLPVGVWLLWLFKKQRSSRSANIYLLNLTIMDLLFNLALTPTLVNYFTWRNKQFWLCGLYFYGISLCGRPLFVACVCVDCYMAVVHPISYMKIRRGTYRLVLSVLIWALTLVYGYLMVYVTPISTMFSLGVSAPVIIFCNLSIVCALRKPDPTGKTNVHPQKQRAMQVMVTSLVFTIVTYPPMLGVCGLYGQVNWSSTEIFCKIMFPCLAVVTVGSTVMPVHYLGNLGGLKKALRLLGCAREG